MTGAITLPAQSTTNAAPLFAAPALVITSKSQELYYAANHVIYHDQVFINHPLIKIWCEQATADFPPHSRQPSHIVCETNVASDFFYHGQLNHAAGDQAIYDYRVVGSVTNETVTLTGNPAKIENPDVQQSGDQIVIDLVKHTMNVINPTTEFGGTPTGTTTWTNAPLSKTNVAPEMK